MLMRRAFNMFVMSPLIALAMLVRPALARLTVDHAEIKRRHHHHGSPGRAPRRASKYYQPNGERECARRRRQIAAGYLRVSQ
jgi:hypothetical protein